MKTAPELSETAVQLIEELRNHKDPIARATASMMDTRFEWHAWEAYKAALADGHPPPDALSAYIRLSGGNIYGFLKTERDPTIRRLLTMLALIELENISSKLAEMLK